MYIYIYMYIHTHIYIYIYICPDHPDSTEREGGRYIDTDADRYRCRDGHTDVGNSISRSGNCKHIVIIIVIIVIIIIMIVIIIMCTIIIDIIATARLGVRLGRKRGWRTTRIAFRRRLPHDSML